MLGSRAGVGAAGEGAALPCSLPRSVWVLQSLLPVFEWADSNGVEGRTGEGVEGMDSERYSVPSRTPAWEKGRKCHHHRKRTGISSAPLCTACSRTWKVLPPSRGRTGLPFHSTFHPWVLKYPSNSSVPTLLLAGGH